MNRVVAVVVSFGEIQTTDLNITSENFFSKKKIMNEKVWGFPFTKFYQMCGCGVG